MSHSTVGRAFFGTNRPPLMMMLLLVSGSASGQLLPLATTDTHRGPGSRDPRRHALSLYALTNAKATRCRRRSCREPLRGARALESRMAPVFAVGSRV